MAKHADVQPPADGRVLLLAMAFGQGAGTMLATSDALQAALGRVSTFLASGSPDDWDTNALRMVEYARALGTLSAVSAAQNRQCVIDLEAVNFALGSIGPHRSFFMLGPCGC